MEIISSVSEMQKRMLQFIKQGKKISFVPTMGFFHLGHLSLMEQAKQENDILVASIFVNPLQFGPTEDYETYPRNEAADSKLAKDIGVDFLFIPELLEMYPSKMLISMAIEERVDSLCGKSRPGHFSGVITVLTKMFNIIQPTSVYMGLKDAQQIAVVDALIKDLNFPIQLVALQTVREADGLAKSSRNIYLNEEDRENAKWLYQSLQKGLQMVVDGEKNPEIIEQEVINLIHEKTSGTIEYAEVLSYPKLQQVATIDQQVIMAVAVQFKNARLIDNVIFKESGNLILEIR